MWCIVGVKCQWATLVQWAQLDLQAPLRHMTHQAPPLRATPSLQGLTWTGFFCTEAAHEKY